MSHFTCIQTQVRDLVALKRALIKLGFQEQDIQVSQFPVFEILDYYGLKHIDKHEDTCRNLMKNGSVQCNCKRPGKPVMAHVKVSSKTLLCAQSQMGFVKNKLTGCFDMVIDRFAAAQTWCKKFAKTYSYEAVMAQIKARGYSIVTESTDTAQCVHVRVQKYTGA